MKSALRASLVLYVMVFALGLAFAEGKSGKEKAKAEIETLLVYKRSSTACGRKVT